MIKEAMAYLLSLGAIHREQIHGNEYTKEELHRVKRDVDF